MSSTHAMQLQLLQQNLQQHLLQKGQIQQQLLEFESALKELPSSEQVYKIVGKLMLAKKKEELLSELEEKKKLMQLRLKTVEEQEEKIKESIKQAQEKLIEEMKS